MKKKILVIFTGSMDLGGVERSLIGLLESIDYDKYDVDLFLYEHRGPLFGMIDKRVNILPEVKELSCLRESFKEKLKNGCYYSAMCRLKDEFTQRIKGHVNFDYSWQKIMRKFAPELKIEYDLAVSFFIPFHFLLEKTHAKVKVGWVHTDHNAVAGNEKNRKYYFNMYKDLDKIVAVSDKCCESFAKVFPTLKSKLVTMENILPAEITKKLAEEPIDDERFKRENDEIVLLSVGRYCDAKNFDNVPEICSLIRQKGLNVKWYIIGFGPDRDLISSQIEKFNMSEYVIMLDKKDNAYPYMKNCDYYIQPSRYEGNCVCVHEAQTLNKPVIITKYATSSNQLNDGFDGVIVPMDIEGCADGIANIINNKELTNRLIENTKKTDFSNRDKIDIFYNLMD